MRRKHNDLLNFARRNKEPYADFEFVVENSLSRNIILVLKSALYYDLTVNVMPSPICKNKH